MLKRSSSACVGCCPGPSPAYATSRHRNVMHFGAQARELLHAITCKASQPTHKGRHTRTRTRNTNPYTLRNAPTMCCDASTTTHVTAHSTHRASHIAHHTSRITHDASHATGLRSGLAPRTPRLPAWQSPPGSGAARCSLHSSRRCGWCLRKRRACVRVCVRVCARVCACRALQRVRAAGERTPRCVPAAQRRVS
jgi:hypothetical protein